MKSVHLSLSLDEPHGSAVPTECHHPGHFLLHCVFQWGTVKGIQHHESKQQLLFLLFLSTQCMASSMFMSILATRCFNICFLYLALKARIIPRSNGWSLEVVFGGKKRNVTLLNFKESEWDVALSRNNKIFLFCDFIPWFTFLIHWRKEYPVIHAFLFDSQ